MSQTLVQRPTPVHDLLSREVIDVDDLVVNIGHNIPDDDDVQFISHRPIRLSHEPIVIGDSDDEVEIVAGPSRPPPPAVRPERNLQIRQVRRPRRRVLFSPSPPPQDNYIPPVPPLPPFARAQPPLRMHPPPDIAGLVRPLEQPLAFEEGLRAEPWIPPIRNAPREQPAAGEVNAARHANIGFGGALFALNRRNQFEPARPAPPPIRTEQAGGWRNFLSDFSLGAYRMFLRQPEGSPGPGARDADVDRDLLEALALGAEERHHNLQFRLLNRHANPQRNREELDYKPIFTHPAKLKPGFSNDFIAHAVISISDEPGPSSANETGTVLVCGKCLDPLVMNVVGPEDEMRKHKLFALRCGHILDGKCVDAIMKPQPVPVMEEDQDSEATSVLTCKEKGHLKVDDSTGTPDNVLPSVVRPEGFTRRSKGKERAVEPEDEASTVPRVPTKRKATTSEISAASADYRRSRLRPRRGGGGPASTGATEPITEAHTPPADVPPLEHTILASQGRQASRPVRRRRGRSVKVRAKGKGKAKASVPIIEAVFEWTCPVPSCGHEHKSVLIEGVWRMDGEQGAIPMYV